MDEHDVLIRLLAIIDGRESVEVDSKDYFSPGNSFVKLKCDGVAIIIFVDTGELDYVDHVQLDDGTVIEFIAAENDPIGQLTKDQDRKLVSLCKALSAPFEAQANLLRKNSSKEHSRPAELPRFDRSPIPLSRSGPADKLLVLPWGRSLHICRSDDDRVESLAVMPGDSNDKQRFAMPFVGAVPGLPGTHMSVPFVLRPSMSRWIAGVAPGFSSVCVIEVDESGQQLHPRLLLLAPDGCRIHSCTMSGSVLYLGGTPQEPASTPALWQIDVQKESLPGFPVDEGRRQLTDNDRVSVDFSDSYNSGEQKSFDVLIVDERGSRLIAIDNTASAKYLIEFSLGDGNSLQQKKSVELVSHGTDEHIVKGLLADQYLFLLSCFAGWSDSDRRCVSIYDSESLREVGSIQLASDACQDIALAHSCLYIAGGEHGLAAIHISRLLENARVKPQSSVHRSDHASSRTWLSSAMSEAIRFQNIDHFGMLKSIVAQERRSRLLAIFESGGEFTPVILRYDETGEMLSVQTSTTEPDGHT